MDNGPVFVEFAAFIPGPIIMGALIDSTCRLWNSLACGKKGACLVYDLDGLRMKMHLYVGIIKTIACVMDVYVRIHTGQHLPTNLVY